MHISDQERARYNKERDDRWVQRIFDGRRWSVATAREYFLRLAAAIPKDGSAPLFERSAESKWWRKISSVPENLRPWSFSPIERVQPFVIESPHYAAVAHVFARWTSEATYEDGNPIIPKKRKRDAEARLQNAYLKKLQDIAPKASASYWIVKNLDERNKIK